jgi:hypothetical protein
VVILGLQGRITVGGGADSKSAVYGKVGNLPSLWAMIDDFD